MLIYQQQDYMTSKVYNYIHTSWCCGRVSDLRSRGRGFVCQPGTMV